MSEEPGPTGALFLDANVLVSAAWKEGAEIALRWKMEDVRLITSNYLMGEVQRNLPRTDQVERLRQLMRSVKIFTFQTLPEMDEAAVLPKKDRPVLIGAIEAGADLLVSGDKRHFGALYGKTIRGVRVISPPELLAVLRRRLR